MQKVDISESSNELGENYEDKDKGYSKIPIDQINLNTEPIEIINDFTQSFFDTNIKSYIKVFLGFVIFVIFLLLISILSGHFHYEKPENTENNNNNNNNNEANNINNNANNNYDKEKIDNEKNKNKEDNNKLLNLRRLNNINEIDFNKKFYFKTKIF